jgi:hypothetical protein
VSSAGTFHSILFDRPAAAAQREDPSLFGDLNLDQVFAAVAAGRDEYDLAPFFATPLGDVSAVQYRHEVQRDLADEALREAVAEFGARMRDMRKYLAQAAKLRNSHQKERWFLDAAGIYCQAVGALAEALAAIEVGSRGFTAFRDYLHGYARSAGFAGLAAGVDKVTGALAAVSYCITIRGNKVRVARYEGEADYSEQVQQTFAKFARSAAKDYRVGFRGLPDMDHVETRILALVARLLRPRLRHRSRPAAERRGPGQGPGTRRAAAGHGRRGQVPVRSGQVRPSLGPDKPGGDRLPAARAGRLHRRAPDSQRPLPSRRDSARRGEEDHRLALP